MSVVSDLLFRFTVRFKYLVGIDEVGRGPLAGAVAVGAVIFYGTGVLEELSPGKDSKQLTPALREEWFSKIKRAQKNGLLQYAVSFVGANVIDTKGLSFSIRKALTISLKKVLGKRGINPAECLVLLDGGLRAPVEFLNQKTIVKGDEKEAIIALASIAAKVLRDRRMVKAGKAYPNYDFGTHKGYGTKAHYSEIGKHGFSPIHRRSFLKNLLE